MIWKSLEGQTISQEIHKSWLCVHCKICIFRLDGGDDGDDLEVSLRKTISLNIELIHCFCLLAIYAIYLMVRMVGKQIMFSICPFPKKSCQQNPYPIYNCLIRSIYDRTKKKNCEEDEIKDMSEEGFMFLTGRFLLSNS